MAVTRRNWYNVMDFLFFKQCPVHIWCCGTDNNYEKPRCLVSQWCEYWTKRHILGLIASPWNITPNVMTAIRTNYDGIYMVKACQIIVRSMSRNKFYSEFALVTRMKYPFFPWPNLIFYKPNVTSRNGPLMHNTTVYTSQVQNRNTWMIVEYHNKLWDNSKSNHTFVWASEKMFKNFCPSLYTAQLYSRHRILLWGL